MPLLGILQKNSHSCRIPHARLFNWALMYRDDDQREFARRLRNQPTGAEKRLWRLLRAGQVDGHKFRRQVAIGVFVVDFACLAEKLVVELDGPQHLEGEAVEYDARRTEWLEGKGYRIVRFFNQEVDEDAGRVVEVIRGALKAGSSGAPTPSPALPSRGRGPDKS